MRKFETKYGYFSENGKEFVITDYNTPKPWINVISNGKYGLVISQVNGGFSWLDNSNLNRITRWQQDLIQDNWGKYFYIKDESSGKYWSPTIKPMLNPLDEYTCTHGIGYTCFHSIYQKIEANLRVFIPVEYDSEIWTLTIQNYDSIDRNLSIYTYLEWCLGAAPDNHREFHKTFIETEFNSQTEAILATKRLWEIPADRGHWNTDWPYTAYFACSEQVDGFETDKENFIGRLRSLAQPLALELGTLNGQTGKWNDPIASLKKSIHLKPGESHIFHFFLGIEKEKSNIPVIIKKLRSGGSVESEYKKVIENWANITDKTCIETPDDAINFMTNSWLQYQTISGRIWARASYYQQSGAYGYRDQLQDSQIFLYSDPELTKKQILLHATHQFKEGHVLHWWHPLSEQGLDARMSDDLLWLPFLVIQYLKETAEWSVLSEQISYYGSEEKESLLKHCLKAIDLVLTRMSDRGLPLILAGDWNDGLSGVGLEKKGESIWLAHFLYYILTEMGIILKHENLEAKESGYLKQAKIIKETVNNIGWDDEWYWRASKDNGEIIGSKANKEGRIFLNLQTWAVIAGVAEGDRQKRVMKSVEQNLESDVGPLLLYPAYLKPDCNIGYLSRYAPGVRENGGVYTHAATWAIWAACILKDSSLVYRLYKKISPIYNGKNPERYMAEPYVTPGNIDGPDSPYYGRGGWSWYTGSAAWLFRITIDHLIGIRADYDGLIIDPCYPVDWETIYITRSFRNTEYRIKIANDSKLPDGQIDIWVEEKKIKGNKLPPCVEKNNVKVIVKRGIS